MQLLDCTLRDGGYVNNWEFGAANIRDILKDLVDAGIDVIECGYLSQKRPSDAGSSYFSDIESINRALPCHKGHSKFVAMINYGEYQAADLPSRREGGLDGLRIAFHKKDRDAALAFCRSVKEKGYERYVQPMVTLNYSDRELLDLIDCVGQLRPEYFYVVDSFGAMKSDDLLRLSYLVDHNLAEGISLGLHSHNNLQLSYSHAQLLCDRLFEREVIIDASILGMGRGAGNLNTELFAEYLNHHFKTHYNISKLLQIVDDVIAPIYQTKYWGYSLPYYLSAVHNCHPNYATYLDNKNTLTVENIHDIFSSMDAEHKAVFDREHIRSLYLSYQSSRQSKCGMKGLRELLHGRRVLMIAPGKSIQSEREKIAAASKEEGTIVISVNFVPAGLPVDLVFVSNQRRWDRLDHGAAEKIILTSNIRTDAPHAYVVDYASLLNTEELVKDNAGMMLVALLIQAGAKEILLAGFDGYSPEEENFADQNMEFRKSFSVMQGMNKGMSAALAQYQKQIPIRFVTTQKNVHFGGEIRTPEKES